MAKPLIVITGASSGIGEALARRFSAEGHALLLLARRVDRLDALDLPDTLCRKVDVTDRTAFRTAVEEAEARYGETECLVNNAGLMLLGDADQQNPDEWSRMVDVNINGVLNGISVVLGKMKQRKGGTIVNISSVAGIKGFPNHMAYCGTKFAVHGLSETLREEVAGDNVRVITIAPGAVETELLSHTTSETIKGNYEGWKESIGGAISSEDIANCVLFACQQPQGVCVREIVVAATRQQP